jgi:hypothetical protein
MALLSSLFLAIKSFVGFRFATQFINFLPSLDSLNPTYRLTIKSLVGFRSATELINFLPSLDSLNPTYRLTIKSLVGFRSGTELINFLPSLYSLNPTYRLTHFSKFTQFLSRKKTLKIRKLTDTLNRNLHL